MQSSYLFSWPLLSSASIWTPCSPTTWGWKDMDQIRASQETFASERWNGTVWPPWAWEVPERGIGGYLLTELGASCCIEIEIVLYLLKIHLRVGLRIKYQTWNIDFFVTLVEAPSFYIVFPLSSHDLDKFEACTIELFKNNPFFRTLLAVKIVRLS